MIKRPPEDGCSGVAQVRQQFLIVESQQLMEDCSYLSPPRLRATVHSDKSSNQATPEYEFLVNDMGDG